MVVRAFKRQQPPLILRLQFAQPANSAPYTALAPYTNTLRHDGPGLDCSDCLRVSRLHVPSRLRKQVSFRSALCQVSTYLFRKALPG